MAQPVLIVLRTAGSVAAVYLGSVAAVYTSLLLYTCSVQSRTGVKL